MSDGGILIAGGYGVVGARIAGALAADYPGRIIIAGRSLARANEAVARIGHGARGRRLDVTETDSITAALDGVSVAIGCIDQPGRKLLWRRFGKDWAIPTSPRT